MATRQGCFEGGEFFDGGISTASGGEEFGGEVLVGVFEFLKEGGDGGATG